MERTKLDKINEFIDLIFYNKTNFFIVLLALFTFYVVINGQSISDRNKVKSLLNNYKTTNCLITDYDFKNHNSIICAYKVNNTAYNGGGSGSCIEGLSPGDLSIIGTNVTIYYDSTHPQNSSICTPQSESGIADKDLKTNLFFPIVMGIVFIVVLGSKYFV